MAYPSQGHEMLFDARSPLLRGAGQTCLIPTSATSPMAHNRWWGIGRCLLLKNAKEAGPQLLLQAWLQRIVNGGGRIEREYGLGRGRTDLYLTWPACAAPRQREVIEIKVKRAKDSLDSVIAQGTEQTNEHMQRCHATHGHLMVFDSDTGKGWDSKVYQRELGEHLTLWGC